MLVHSAAKTESSLWRMFRVEGASKGNAGREVWVKPARVMRDSVWIAAGGSVRM